MMLNSLGRRRSLGRVLVVLVAAAFAVLVAASSAFASGFTVFSECPTSNPTVGACLYAQTTSGTFTIGAKSVKVTKTITLQGGISVNEETGAESFVGAANGETLSKTPQTVPGGLLGIEGLGGEVTATTELAGPASNIGISTEDLLAETGTALALPVKLKLGNPFLGPNCYGGSNAHPIVLDLTTGKTSPPKPNEPIKGSAGTVSTEEEGLIIVLNGNRLVNNSFAAPGVEGCGLIPFFVDPLVDLAMGVPAGAGHNTAILEGTQRIASAEVVKEHL